MQIAILEKIKKIKDIAVNSVKNYIDSLKVKYINNVDNIETEQLNKKKVVMAISIGFLLIISIIVFIISRVGAKNIEKETEITMQVPESKVTTYSDANNSISIELDKKYNLVQAQNNDYLIKLSSDKDVDVYISKLEGLEGRELSSIARADRLAYLESYNTYSNSSDLRELDINGNQAYTYSFHYLDENLKKAFYIQVVLLKIGNDIYVFDVDFPLDELNFYTNLLPETLSTFRTYSIKFAN